MTNTATQMIPAVGAIVAVRFEEITVFCHVVDVKNSWGKIRLQVTPELGNGSQWIELPRVIEVVRQPTAGRAPEWARTNGLIGEGR